VFYGFADQSLPTAACIGRLYSTFFKYFHLAT